MVKEYQGFCKEYQGLRKEYQGLFKEYQGLGKEYQSLEKEYQGSLIHDHCLVTRRLAFGVWRLASGLWRLAPNFQPFLYLLTLFNQIFGKISRFIQTKN